MNKYNQIQRKEFQHLRVLIEAMLGINVRDERSRRQDIVNARIIYANILKEQGFGCSIIAKSIRKKTTFALWRISSKINPEAEG